MRTSEQRKVVTIVYKSLPQYRRAFFERLKEALVEHNIELNLLYGQPSGADGAKRDTVDIPWAHRVRNRYIKIRDRELIWQPILPLLKGVDLVIVEQASKLLVNYVLQIKYLALRAPRLAFWGHGRNFQRHSASGLGEAVKRAVSRHVHWWFAYNETSVLAVRSLGVPDSRITNVQNAIDTKDLVEAKRSVTADQVERIRQSLRLIGNNVAIYSGGIYEEKRIAFLVEACRRIRQLIPDFELVVIGTGVQADLIKAAAFEETWIKYVGPKFDRDKVPYFALAKVALMPGLVGLAVLDSFALEVPLVTTDIDFHSPEIEYLEDGINGVIVEDALNPFAYADVVAGLLTDEDRLATLRAGCREAQTKYTIEEMVTRFTAGVLEALR